MAGVPRPVEDADRLAREARPEVARAPDPAATVQSDPHSKYRLGVHVEQICAKLLAGINFERFHAELAAALDGITTGKAYRDFVEGPID